MSRPINDDVFRAVAHPVRRRILEMLERQERSAGDIASSFRMTQPAISAHLRVLRNTRLISERRRGHRRVYQRNVGGLRAIHAWMRAFARDAG